MQEIMRIGNELVPADKDIKDIMNASTEITDIAHKYKTDVLAVVGKGDKHNIVTQCRENDTTLADDVIRTTSLVQALADTYGENAEEIAATIKTIVDK